MMSSSDLRGLQLHFPSGWNSWEVIRFNSWEHSTSWHEWSPYSAPRHHHSMILVFITCSSMNIMCESKLDWFKWHKCRLGSDLIVSVKLITRFPEVAQLKSVSWFEASGDFEVALPPGSYTLSWRIRLERPSNFNNDPAHFTFSKNDLDVSECVCYIDPRPEGALRATGNYKLPTIRVLGNGWQEYDVAEFSVYREEPSCTLQVSLVSIQETSWKSGISMDGIVIRRSVIIKNLQRDSSHL